MLGLFGLIKENLEFQGKLPDKWIDWKNALYKEAKLSKETHLEYDPNGAICYYLLAPENKSCPVDLMNYPWSFEASVLVPRIAYTDSTGATEQFVMQACKEEGGEIFQLKHHVRSVVCGFAPKINSGSVASTSRGFWTLKIEYTPSTATTGVIKAYYKINAADYILIKSYDYDASTHGEIKRLRLIHWMHDAEAAVSGIKFTHNGKVLFGRDQSYAKLKFYQIQSDNESVLEFEGTEFPTKGKYCLSNLGSQNIKLDWTKNWCISNDAIISSTSSTGWIENSITPNIDRPLSWVVLGAANVSRMTVYKQIDSNDNRNYLYRNTNVSLNGKTCTQCIVYEARTKTLHCAYKLSSSSSWVNAASVSISDLLASDANGTSCILLVDEYENASFNRDSIYFAYDGEVLFGS